MKPLASPFLWLTLLQGAALAWWWLRRRTLAAPSDRRVVRLLAAAWIAMTALALEPVADLLGASLTVRDSAPAPAPDAILVLGDGIIRGTTPDADRVTWDEWERVRLAAAWWKEQRTARIVLQGRSAASNRRPEHLGELARAVLMAEGVPDSAITIEPRSRTTWQHPAEVLKVPGITRSRRVGIVTSAWHMRRARAVFAGIFAELQWRTPDTGSRDLGWASFLPDPAVLAESGAYVKEWVGNVAYALRHLVTSP